MTSQFKVKCSTITTATANRMKLDADGKHAKDDKGNYLYEPCTRTSITLAVCGDSTRHGSFNIQTTHDAEAAKYVLGGVYWLTVSDTPKESS